MTKEEFAKFVEQKNRASQEVAQINWAATREAWLQDLARFYEMVEQFLGQFRQQGQIKLERSKTHITEEHLGEYEADSMTIGLGSEKVSLIPIGTLLVGAKGRVDMIGPAGTAKFVLVGKHSNGIKTSVTVKESVPGVNAASVLQRQPEQIEEVYVWKLATPPPKVRLIKLDAETFFSTLTDVING